MDINLQKEEFSYAYVVPDNVSDWLNQSEEQLCLRRCGYWISLAGADATENQETVTVSIPTLGLPRHIAAREAKLSRQRIALKS